MTPGFRVTRELETTLSRFCMIIFETDITLLRSLALLRMSKAENFPWRPRKTVYMRPAAAQGCLSSLTIV